MSESLEGRYVRGAQAVRVAAENDLEREAIQLEHEEPGPGNGPPRQALAAVQDAESLPSTSVRSPAEALRAMPSSAGRLTTGFAVLDHASRGGARVGEVWTFVGGPGSAKSTIMEQIAKTFAIVHRSPVVAIHSDEGDGPAAIRLGQMLGFDREKLEAKDPDTILAFEAKLAGVGYDMVAPNEITLEVAIEKLSAMAAEYLGPPVLLVDTVHAVECSAGDEARSDKERAEAIVGVYRAAATRGCIVLVGAEAVKSFYASRDPNKQTTGMAAAAESRAITHKAEIVIPMRPTEQEDVFEARIEKNRIGTIRPRFHLRLDPSIATLSELDEQLLMEQADQRKARAATDEALALQGKIEVAIDNQKNYRKGYPGISENQLAKLCRVDKRKRSFLDALHGLQEAQKVLEAVPGPRDGIYYRRPVAAVVEAMP